LSSQDRRGTETELAKPDAVKRPVVRGSAAKCLLYTASYDIKNLCAGRFLRIVPIRLTPGVFHGAHPDANHVARPVPTAPVSQDRTVRPTVSPSPGNEGTAMRIRKRYAIPAVITLLLAGGGTAAYATVIASPVSSSGVIHGCYTNAEINGSHMFVLQDQNHACPKGTTPISWNQTGPSGPAGPTGATGPAGPAGPSGTAAFGTNTQEAVAGTGAECTLGEVILSAGAVANGMPANGQLLSIGQNQALFSLLGTTYGGDGITTFALPNLGAVAPNGLTYSICVAGVYPSHS
jgi:hypothetical protein